LLHDFLTQGVLYHTILTNASVFYHISLIDFYFFIC